MKTTKPIRRRYRSAQFALIGALFSTTAASASADTSEVEKAAVRLPAQRLADLRVDVARARAVDPGSFIAVSNIVARAPESAKRARNFKANTAREIARLGPNAVMPALELLAVDPPHGLPAASVPIVRRDLVEAVGLLRDARGLPVLSTILDGQDEDAETLRTTAEAIARIGTDEAADKLVATLQSANVERGRAVVAGMGECRRVRVVDAIAARLRATNDDLTVRAASRAIGRAGNAWAWQAAGDRSEETAIRETAARALVETFVRQQGEARDAASNALMVVDAPITPSLIAAAKSGASPDTVQALERLAARFARNPSRVR